MSDLRRIGAEAEDKAAEHLLSEGYTIVTRRFKSRRGEIDIVAIEGETLVFVEVKWSARHVPELQVDDKKVAHFSEAVGDYLHKHGMQSKKCRFDIIAVTPHELRHHKAAFRAQSETYTDD